MTILDSKMRAVALALLAKYGGAATWASISRVGDSDAGVATETVTTHSVKIAPPSVYEEQYVDGDVIQSGDMQTSVAASAITFTPRSGDRLTFDGVEWLVVAVSPVYSGDQVALWEVQVRR